MQTVRTIPDPKVQEQVEEICIELLQMGADPLKLLPFTMEVREKAQGDPQKILEGMQELKQRALRILNGRR